MASIGLMHLQALRNTRIQPLTDAGLALFLGKIHDCGARSFAASSSCCRNGYQWQHGVFGHEAFAEGRSDKVEELGLRVAGIERDSLHMTTLHKRTLAVSITEPPPTATNESEPLPLAKSTAFIILLSVGSTRTSS